MKENKKWVKIPEYEMSYEISDIGDIKSVKRKTIRGVRLEEKILKQTKNNDGYFTVGLCNHTSVKTKLVHRLVALAFIPNHENKPTVNHKNGNKNDNSVGNLEWATNSEQNIHRYRVLKNKKPSGLSNITGSKHHYSKKVLCVDTGKEYGSQGEAARDTGIWQSYISKMCRGLPMDNYSGKKFVFV